MLTEWVTLPLYFLQSVTVLSHAARFPIRIAVTYPLPDEGFSCFTHVTVFTCSIHKHLYTKTKREETIEKYKRKWLLQHNKSAHWSMLMTLLDEVEIEYCGPDIWYCLEILSKHSVVLIDDDYNTFIRYIIQNDTDIDLPGTESLLQKPFCTLYYLFPLCFSLSSQWMGRDLVRMSQSLRWWEDSLVWSLKHI